jgi:tetratricopeptide (TPR) repeat protein
MPEFGRTLRLDGGVPPWCAAADRWPSPRYRDESEEKALEEIGRRYGAVLRKLQGASQSDCGEIARLHGSVQNEVVPAGAPTGWRANALGGFAYRLLQCGHDANALKAAQAALALTPNQKWIETNLAHALMFLGRTKEAEHLYKTNIGAWVVGERKWEEVIREDFRELRGAGRDHAMMAEMENLFSR